MIRKKLSGFALIEVSIALLILGIITSIVMSQFSIMKRLQAETTTQSNIDYVLKALGCYYVLTGGHLPYPARNDDTITGRELMGNTNFGVVPYKTLGIMEKYAKDGYGNWLQYRRNPDFGRFIYEDKLHTRRNMSISDFESNIPGDKVAIIIKYYCPNSGVHGVTERLLWYSEKNFIQLFANGKHPSAPRSIPVM